MVSYRIFILYGIIISKLHHRTTSSFSDLAYLKVSLSPAKEPAEYQSPRISSGPHSISEFRRGEMSSSKGNNDFPSALQEACVTGDLHLVKMLYNDCIKINPSSCISLLTQMLLLPLEMLIL